MRLLGLVIVPCLGQLIEIEDSDQKLVDIPALRELFTEFDQGQLSAIEDACSPLASVWLKSQFEESPLVNLRPFASDAACINEFVRNLHAFIEIEKARDEVIRAYVNRF